MKLLLRKFALSRARRVVQVDVVRITVAALIVEIRYFGVFLAKSRGGLDLRQGRLLAVVKSLD